MIEVFGAPISEPDAREIVGYLASAYGPTPPFPALSPQAPLSALWQNDPEEAI